MRISRVGTGVAGILTLAAFAAPATALENPVRHQEIGVNCWGLSPNLLDLPYSGKVTIMTHANEPGLFTVGGGGRSLFGYTTDTRVDWRNLDNGRTGSATVSYPQNMYDTSIYRIYNQDSGPGRVALTITATNRGLLTLPAPTCTGEAII
ncbi:hypothetical protein [Nocardia sp. NPDC051832]|uniref:hypothetical protein n=1 Tax=Nocardia sp. NPDC051832 TaxID=3155673 RepID=UPI003432BE68